MKNKKQANSLKSITALFIAILIVLTTAIMVQANQISITNTGAAFIDATVNTVTGNSITKRASAYAQVSMDLGNDCIQNVILFRPGDTGFPPGGNPYTWIPPMNECTSFLEIKLTIDGPRVTSHSP